MLDIEDANQKLEGASPVQVLHWAAATFREGLVATSSFQSQSLPLLHLISRICPHIPIYFLDTGFHFPETLTYVEQLKSLMFLNVERVQPLLEHEEFLQLHGNLYETKPDMCCYLNKVEPLQRVMSGKVAWVTGIRRDQTAHRSKSPVLTRQSDGIIKVAPMLEWKHDDVQRYVKKYALPEHPLLKQGYPSIGCFPCTKPVADGEDARSGRWTGNQKTECGLHFDPASGKLVRQTQQPE